MISHPPSNDLTLAKRRPLPHVSLWLLACLLLTFVQVPWRGYQLGVGNQSVQIPFLQSLHDPSLFTHDEMVRQTLAEYPSFFFHICANFLSILSLPTLYLLLHLIATAGVFCAVAALSRSIVRDHWTALTVLLFLLAGHHEALAGETLYSTGFTHTWAVFPLSLLALVLFFRENYFAAFALAGAIFNLHALEAGHLVLLMGFVALCQVRRTGLLRLGACAIIFLAAAAPTLLVMATHRQAFASSLSLPSATAAATAPASDLPTFQDWLLLMHRRSADHSFPSTWWQSASKTLPRFIAIIGLAALALSFPMPPSRRRKLLLLAAGAAILFAVGYIFADLIPVSLVIRAQFYRSSRILMIIAFILIAHGCVCAGGAPWRKDAALPRWIAWLEFAAAALTALTLALPSMLDLLPLALLATLIVALLAGRLAWHQALIAGLSLLVSLAAWQSIKFVIPGLSSEFVWKSLLPTSHPTLAGGLILLAALTLWVLAARALPRWPTLLTALAAALGIASLGFIMVPAILNQPPANDKLADWIAIQQFAAKNTPTDAVFLTPPDQSGFRIFSNRAIVGEWRDGTQLYFSTAFARTWADRMDLVPGMSLDELDGDALKNLAESQHANYIVLHSNVDTPLTRVVAIGDWAIYEPRISPAATATLDQTRFIRTTALPNIEKYRKSDARIQILSAPASLPYRLTETSSSFAFGASLPFFKASTVDTHADYKPPAVTPAELARFLEIFNYSVIRFSGQWRFLEPQAGKPDYTDLDQYVQWCADHAIRPEFHFLSGYQPAWLKTRRSADQTALLLARTRDLGRRYGTRIADWQVIADKIALPDAVGIFQELRKLNPSLRLGISDDARFWSPRLAQAQADLAKAQSDTEKKTAQDKLTRAQAEILRGLDDIKWLRSKGAQVDFFAFQAENPTGLWADGRQIYDALDAFQKENIPVHITEFGVPVGARIEGPVNLDRWDPRLQAQYYEQFFTVCFSHPDVEAINIAGMGADTWLDGEGLLDPHGNPTPAFDALKDLITQRWRTRLQGNLAPDGALNFRGFHGTYELAVTLPSGKTAFAHFTIDPKKNNAFRFQLDTAAATLSPVEDH